MAQTSTPRAGELPSSTYRILVAGALDSSWSRRAAGMAVVVHRGGDDGTTTELVGSLADQAALMGVIDRLYSCGAKLLTVQHLPAGPGEACPMEVQLRNCWEVCPTRLRSLRSAGDTLSEDQEP